VIEIPADAARQSSERAKRIIDKYIAAGVIVRGKYELAEMVGRIRNSLLADSDVENILVILNSNRRNARNPAAAEQIIEEWNERRP
jgi:hypothetical protein